MSQLDGTGLKRLHREWRRRTDGRLALVLEDVQSPFNVGAIVRTAAAYRVDHVWLAGSAPDLDSARVGKTALGCDRYLTWSRTDDGVGAVAAAAADGYLVVALELTANARPLHELLAPPAEARDVALVVGAEDRGVRPPTVAACEAQAFLPQLGRVGSLNVAAATAIACYEVRRRRWS